MQKTRKIGLNMRVDLYKGLAKLAKENGQTIAYVLEQAAQHYIEYAVPTQRVVRPAVMAHVRKPFSS